jgi:aspartyl-tRNA(Asn)/glutamyl-tRNA(Gln) amidotransferase subunit C
MISREEIQKLALLARIPVTDEEAAGYARDMEEIVRYVAQVQKIPEVTNALEGTEQRREMRADGEPHEGGIYTDALLSAAPEKENGFVKVKKIL